MQLKYLKNERGADRLCAADGCSRLFQGESGAQRRGEHLNKGSAAAGHLRKVIIKAGGSQHPGRTLNERSSADLYPRLIYRSERQFGASERLPAPRQSNEQLGKEPEPILMGDIMR